MGMKIAFVGASGTGKTTLANMVAKEFSLEFNPVGSRSTTKAMGFSNPYDVDKASANVYDSCMFLGFSLADCAKMALESGDESNSVRPRFQKRLQLTKIEWESSRDNFISDRSTLDDFAYTALHAVNSIDCKFALRAREHMLTYDLVFFCPIESFINLSDDPARVKDLQYHRVFEYLVKGALDSWEIAHYTVPGLEWREEYVYSTICEVEHLRGATKNR